MNRLVLFLLIIALAACTEQGVKPDVQPAKPTPEPVVNSVSGTVFAPAWTVGDRWTWSDGYGLEVSAKDGDKTTFKRLDAAEQWQVRQGLFVVESRSATTHRKVVYRDSDPMALFPLQDGKKTVFRREYLANGQLRVHNTSWSVEGKQQIRVPAGEFDCWILVRRTRSQSSNWVGYERWWYSPKIKHYARMEYQYGEGKPGSRVLMNYHLR